MNKQTVQLPGAQGVWDSYISKYQPDSQKVLDNMFTANSKNFVTDQTGMIDKRQGGTTWNRTTFSGPARDSYDAVFQSGAQHYLRVGQGVLSASTGNGIFTNILSGLSTVGNFEFVTYQDRVYGDNGINSPIVYDTVTNYGGVSYSFTTGMTKVMGAQPPLTAPVAGTPTAGGNVPPGPHRYEVTFLYYDSEESNGSPASNVETATGTLANDTTQSPNIPFTVSSVIDGSHLAVSSTTGMMVGDTITQGTATTTIVAVMSLTELQVLSTSGWTSANNTIPLTNIPIGGYGVTARNIYRDDNDGVFLLVGTINDNTTTIFTDSVYQGSTPTPIPTDNGVPPTFSKIALWLDAIWIAPTGNTNTLLFSNAGSPDIFGGNNFVVCQSDDIITGLQVYNGTLYVFGLHSFGSIQGTTPDTFYYYNISDTVGCTDNRTIEIRSVISVPTLWWLSTGGIYYSNGYTVEYGSDLIQDLINLNIAQVNYSLGKNTQNSQAQYAGDTYTPGIDIIDIPGTITTINPEADYSQTSDWLGGSVVTNLDTGNFNLAEVPTQFVPALSTGVYGGQAEVDSSGNNITLPLSSDFTGETSPDAFDSGAVTTASHIEAQALAIPIVPTVSGTFTGCNFKIGVQTDIVGISWAFTIWSESLGLPSSILFQQTITTPNLVMQNFSISCSVAMTGGQQYYFGVRPTGSAIGGGIIAELGTTQMSGGHALALQDGSGVWSNATALEQIYPFNYIDFPAWFSSYTFVKTIVSETGTWTSPVYDCGAISSIPSTLIVSASYPTNTSSSITVYTSASSSMTSPNTQVFSNLNGTVALTLTGLEFWQVITTVNTTDNREVPLVSAPVLQFSNTASWVSQPINATTDNTGWGTLTYVGNTPTGTSISVAIATSPDNITYSSFGPISGAVTEPWAKIQFILTTDSGNTVTPSLSEITLTWNLTSTITSSPIDTGTTPAGFSTMQYVTPNPGVGTVTMYLRTATTSGGLSSATYVLVPNGTFPDLTPDEWLQWQLVFTATANTSPQVTSITVNWFIGSGTQGVRAASLFFNKTYYLSVATIGSTFNNVLIELDQFGKWRIQRDNSVGTFLLYFNTLYFSDGENGNIYNGFISPTDNGTAIVMDVRTKAWHETDDLFLKVPRALKVTGIHTGTLIHAYYSTDRGNTFIEMFNEMGTYGYQTTTTGLEFVTLFVVDFDTLDPGRTLMFRLVSEDILPCSIINFEPTMYSRKGRYLANG
jgi:hypothetical protein